MKDFQGTVFIQGVPSTGMYWKGRIIHHRLLVSGIKQGREPMKMSIPLRGILGGMKRHMLIHTIWILVTLTTTMIMGLTGLLGTVDVIVMITCMMIMITELVFPTKAGKIAESEIMIMVGTVMILIMSEEVGEMVIG